MAQGKRPPEKEARLAKAKEMGISIESYTETPQLPKPITEQKVRECAKKISKGVPRLEIINEFMDNYSVSFSTAEKYYVMALDFLAPKDLEKYRDSLLAKSLANYEDLYKKAYDAGQWRTAKDILDSLNKIFGTYGTNRVDIAENNEGEKTITISFGD